MRSPISGRKRQLDTPDDQKNTQQVHATKGGWSINGGIQSKVVLCMLGMFAVEQKALAARKAAGVRLRRKPGAENSRLDKCRLEIPGAAPEWVQEEFYREKGWCDGADVV